MENLSYTDILGALVCALAMLTAYNTYCTARDHKRAEDKRNTQPVTDVQTALASDKRRIESLEKAQTDDHEGMMALCAGVQALLEHELHNGNSDQMTEAAQTINKWLLKR